MNENLDLTKILKNCPIGFELYSPICGYCSFYGLGENIPTIITTLNGINYFKFDKEGHFFFQLNFQNNDTECLLFPSKDQRDWSKFIAPWRKKEKFDPKTLQPFDRVLVRDFFNDEWVCDCFSNISKTNKEYPYSCIAYSHKMCIPYNEDTKYLLGANDEAPEYYRYWEN